MRRLDALRRRQCFDPQDLDSRPVFKQAEFLHDILYFMHRYFVAGNQSGKSQCGGREASWIFEENHPEFQRPADWGTGRLTLIVIGQTAKQVEEVLWNEKIKPFLDPGSFREVRVGGALHKVIHKKNKNVILFFSHHAAASARKDVQSYVAHWVWLDEMPGSYLLLEELHRRIQAKRGRFIATFTPKVRNAEIRKVVDSDNPYQKTYKMGMLDNPIYKGREEEILAPMANFPEALRKTILNGDWYIGDTAVYHFNPDAHIADPPESYSPGWRHVEAIDPAASSKAGYVLLAEDPATGKWYVIRADYFQGASAKSLLDTISKRIGNVNIVRRTCDIHESWFIRGAAEEGVFYTTLVKKHDRKKELIKNLQKALDDGRLSIGSHLRDLIAEFSTCQWSETAIDKIVGSRRFHILDSLQYALDILPKWVPAETPLPFYHWLRNTNQERKKSEEAAAKRRANRGRGRLKRG